jgi:putative N6-adenine-specific DNA methylase
VTVGRGGLKLEAAIERFGLAPRVRGARAIDVGASTGGFTECLLRHGAASVLAVDVGRGQLHPSLRADPRVESLEGVEWKTLPLAVAPGPFDFFTVDVSFVAARNMLRGLAFRLRPGAEGVVLIKPQFELPSGQVRDGNVVDPQLRTRAVERVREKAEGLGFTIVEHADSPVAGGSGTVEILAHLRFAGRSARLPQPGERRPPSSVRQPATRQIAAVVAELRCFAVAAPGIEPVLEREVRALPGAGAVRAVEGGVEFSGSLELVYRANLWLRTATRVLVRLGELEAREFAQLRRRAGTLAWAPFLAPGVPVEVNASASRCRLYHTGAIAENLQAAAADALGKAAAPSEQPPLRVIARGVGDRWTLSVDSSGELLHRRGWRRDGAEAPLRETLAAALLLFCEWDSQTPFVDPMCGAGTLPIEACALALGRAPGLDRAFAFERWPHCDAATWARLRDEARQQARAAPPAPVVASDHAQAAVAAARANAERAGVAAHVSIARAELADVQPPPAVARGLVLLNPPYGRRVGDTRQLRELYRRVGRLWRERFTGWRAGALIADPRLATAFGLAPRQQVALVNGGLRVTLLIFDVPSASRR